MGRGQKGGPATRAVRGQSALMTEARTRTLELRDALLRSAAGSEQVARRRFNILYWEHRGQKILPSREGHQSAVKARSGALGGGGVRGTGRIPDRSSGEEKARWQPVP